MRGKQFLGFTGGLQGKQFPSLQDSQSRRKVLSKGAPGDPIFNITEEDKGVSRANEKVEEPGPRANENRDYDPQVNVQSRKK